MAILPIQYASATPPIGAIIGCVASDEVVRSINHSLSGGRVMFRQEDDPLANRYRNFKDAVIKTIDDASREVSKIRDVFYEYERIRPFHEEDDLYVIPNTMKNAILQIPVIKDLYNEGRIEAFGVDDEHYPDDPWIDRIYEMGASSGEYEDGACMPEELVCTAYGDDPEFTEEEETMFRHNYDFINRFVYDQLKADGSRLDPTNMPNTIGQLR